jgi:MFS family permease
LAVTSGLLLIGALGGRPPLGFLYLVAATQSALYAMNSPTRTAILPTLIGKDLLPSALALSQVVFNTTMIVGPAVGGLILARYGLAWAYATDVISFGASIAAAALLRPLPPERQRDRATSGWEDVKEGFGFLRRRRLLISTFLIDLNAMIFGMPRAVFPALAFVVFKVGPAGLGLLYSAPALGALIGALTAGWVGGVRHQGRAVVWAVAAWGAAIAAFGFSGSHFVVGLGFLAIAGGADVISAVFRGSILQLSTPDQLRGRVSAVHIMVVTGGPRLGDAEAGTLAALVSPIFSVVSGGLICLVGAFAVARLYPELWRYHADPGPLTGGPPITPGPRVERPDDQAN